MERKIAFERVKKIALENVGPISDKLGAGGGSLWSSAANMLVTAMKTYVDGKPIRARRVALMIQDKVREFIRGLDVRCIGELLELCPQYVDNRLPGWLYGQVDAYMDYDTGEWMLEPRAAA